MNTINDDQKKLIEQEAIAVATVNSDGSPNVIAVSFVKVVSENEMIITDNLMNTTLENIKRDSRICLAVWTHEWSEGYKIIGEANYHADGKWLKFVKKMKENEGFPAKGAILVKVKNIYKLC